VSPTPVRVRY